MCCTGLDVLHVRSCVYVCPCVCVCVCAFLQSKAPIPKGLLLGNKTPMDFVRARAAMITVHHGMCSLTTSTLAPLRKAPARKLQETLALIRAYEIRACWCVVVA